MALAEWLSVTYGGQGVGVSVLCPLGVATPLLMDPLAAGDARRPGGGGVRRDHHRRAGGRAVLAGIAEERFLILPHPEVGTFWGQKASDPDRWLAGVRRLVARGRQ